MQPHLSYALGFEKSGCGGWLCDKYLIHRAYIVTVLRFSSSVWTSIYTVFVMNYTRREQEDSHFAVSSWRIDGFSLETAYDY